MSKPIRGSNIFNNYLLNQNTNTQSSTNSVPNGFKQVPLNEFLYGQQQMLTPFSSTQQTGPGWTAVEGGWQRNMNKPYDVTVAGAGSQQDRDWTAQQVLGGKDPVQWFKDWNASKGIDQDTFQGWDQGGARYDPATGMVTVPKELGGDPFGPLLLSGLMAGVGGLSGGFGLGELFGGGLGGGAGAAEELAALTGSGGSGGAGVGGFGGFGGVDTSWGVNPQGSMNDIIEQTGNFTVSDPVMPWNLPATSGGGNVLTEWLKSNPELARLLGTGGSTLLGILGADKKADGYNKLLQSVDAGRLPFRNQAEQWMTNPQAYFQGPGKAAVDANLRALSSTYGNPIDSPTALGIASDAGLRNWQNAVLGFGNVGLGGQGLQAQLGSQAVNADSGIYDALGYGLENIFNPKPNNLEQLLKQIAGGGKLSFGGV